MARTTIPARHADPRTGRPCHTQSHTRAARSDIRRARKSDALGLHIAAGLLDPRTGLGVCTYCGGDGTLALGLDVSLDLCHDIPDAHGGALCWCSLRLGHRACNLAAGDETTFSDFDTHTDPAAYVLAGGLWAPYENTRARRSDESRAVSRCAIRVDGVVPLTLAGEDMVRELSRRF